MECGEGGFVLKALPVLAFKYTGLEVGSYRLCWHNFENNM